MKNNLLNLFVFCLFAGGLLLASCGDDDVCADANCPANSTCFLGDCVCDNGFVQDSLTGACVCPAGFAIDADGNCIDGCSVITCGDNSECVDGACVCDAGFEADADGNCTIETRAKFFGNYSVSEICIEYFSSNDSLGTSFTASYSLSIATATTGVSNLVLTGLGDSGTDVVTATLVGSDSLTINPSQDITVGGSEFRVVSAGGKINADRSMINLNYSLANPANGDVEFICDGDATRL